MPWYSVLIEFQVEADSAQDAGESVVSSLEVELPGTDLENCFALHEVPVRIED